jgi:hypothetical protein
MRMYPRVLMSMLLRMLACASSLCTLQDAAHGDAFLAPHAVLESINPTCCPNDKRDLFMELLTAFNNRSIKVIACGDYLWLNLPDPHTGRGLHRAPLLSCERATHCHR